MTFGLPGGYRMRFHPSAISAALWQERSFRQEDVDVCTSILRPGDTFVDVGANVGQLSIVAARRVGRQGRVVAIEAHPRTFGFLRDNLALNQLDWVDARNTALGDEEGRISFTDLSLDDQNAVATPGATASVEVPLTTLDFLWPETAGDIRLLKIDVEGFEAKVLAGGASAIRRCAALYIEESERNLARFGSKPAELRHTLNGLGFEIFGWSADGWRRNPPFALGENSQNLMALRRGVVPEIDLRRD